MSQITLTNPGPRSDEIVFAPTSQGVASEIKTFSFSGVDLIGPVQISAPAHYEIRNDSALQGYHAGFGFSSYISIPAVGRQASGQISVRVKNTAPLAPPGQGGSNNPLQGLLYVTSAEAQTRRLYLYSAVNPFVAGLPIITEGQGFYGKIGESFSPVAIGITGGSGPVSSWSAGLPWTAGVNVCMNWAQSLPRAADGAPFGFACVTPGLPPGLTINGAGQISGIPTTISHANPDRPVFVALITPTGPSGTGPSVEVDFIISVGAPLIAANQTFSGTVGGAFSATPVLTDSISRPATNWSATGLPAWAAINETTGAITGTPISGGATSATITATGPGGTNTQTVIISITAVGAPPQISGGQLFSGMVGTPFNKTPSLAGPGAVTSWIAAGLPSWATIHSVTGAITGTPQNAGSTTITLTAFGPGGTDTKTAEIFISQAFPPPIIALGQVFSGKVGENIDAALTRLSMVDIGSRPVWGLNGVAPPDPGIRGFNLFHFLVPGSQQLVNLLPPGVVFDAAQGAFSGVPLATGGYTFYIQAHGPGGHSIGDQMTAIGSPADDRVIGFTKVHFNVQQGPPIINSNQSLGGSVGVSFSATPALTDSANRPVTSWVASGLPPGLSINTSTGAITGTPQNSGSTTIALTATGPGGADTKTATISIAVGPPIITARQSFTGKVGVALSAALTLDDALNRPATSWQLLHTPPHYSFPPGLSLNAATGEITGTPTGKGSWDGYERSYPSVRAQGPGGWSEWRGFAFHISEGAPIIVANQSFSGFRGVAFSATPALTNSANRPVTSWAASGLPSGFSINNLTGTITGTTQIGGTSTITLTATGPGGTSDTVTATITISRGAPVINPGQAFAGKVGDGFNATRLTLDPVGGDASSWVIVSGTMPPGITIDGANGNISGIPESVGTYSLQIRASNSDGSSTEGVSFVISPGAPLLISETFGAAVGMSVKRFVGAINTANRPITSFSSTNLPSWVTLGPSTGAYEGTPPAVGTYTFTVQATGSGGSSSATITINVGSGVGYYELIDASTGKVHVRTLESNFVISNLEPSKTYNFELRAWNGGGPSAPQSIQVTTLPLAGRPSGTDRLRILPATQKFSASNSAQTLPVSVDSADKLMKNVWVKKTSQASAQFESNASAFNGGFIRGEDVIDADWVIDGISANQYDRSKDRILLTEGVPTAALRYETPNFVAAYGGEGIDGQLRQTILNARIYTGDSLPNQWFAEAFMVPGRRLRLSVLFYTNMFNTILRVGGPTLHFGAFNVPHTLEAQEARMGRGLTQLLGEGGSQSFVKTTIDVGEDEHVVFFVRNIGGMRDTQTSLVVVAEL